MSLVGCEFLESRKLLSVNLKSDGSLAVIGTAGDDVIGLKVVDVTLRVDFNGVLSTFAAAAVRAVGIDLRDGNDLLGIGAGVIGVYVLGGLGDDTITGGLAADTITAGGGRDLVDGSLGDDRIDGGPTPDRLIGGEGADRIYGGDANDILEGGGNVDRLFGGFGNDALVGGSSNDKLYGDDGADSLYGNNQNDLLTGGTGNDEIYAGDGRDTLVGNDGDDTLLGQADADTVFGDAGDDLLNGGGGNDILDAGGDADYVASSDGNDTSTGGAGDDEVYGEFGNDIVDGGDGDDLVTGGPDTDRVSGGPGNDAIFGSLGTDTLNGNAGADRYLQWNGDAIEGRASEDAVVAFADGSNGVRWTPDEIIDIDAGLRWLVQRTGNTRLLKQSNGNDVRIRRAASLGQDVLANNEGGGRINMADLAFDSGDAAATIVHELGHNYDETTENATIEQFRGISRWSEQFNRWSYSGSAGFASEYGKTNPMEDFATSLEVYFSQTRAASLWQSKWNYIDGFLNSKSG
ncbi:MAG: hypothetical protein ABIP55_13825 [Tepidisphaeraceae bacterium]